MEVVCLIFGPTLTDRTCSHMFWRFDVPTSSSQHSNVIINYIMILILIIFYLPDYIIQHKIINSAINSAIYR